MLFQSWSSALRPVLFGALAYVALLALLRLTGKRTLAKLNAFDLVVTVALGSSLATVLLSEQVSLVAGVLGLATLAILQFVVAFLSVRLPPFRRFVKARPTLLMRDGKVLEEALYEQRVVREEVLQAVRQHGYASLSDVLAVVLETDGSISVVAKGDAAHSSALQDVLGWEQGSRSARR